jgi:hypothetical protein
VTLRRLITKAKKQFCTILFHQVALEYESLSGDNLGQAQWPNMRQQARGHHRPTKGIGKFWQTRLTRKAIITSRYPFILRKEDKALANKDINRSTRMVVKPWQPVLCLRPTQFSIGILEAECKAKEMKACSSDKLRHILRSTRIPIIVSPWRTLYVIDHHHFLFACWHANIKEVKVEVIKDYSEVPLTHAEFWERMVVNNHAYLYDQFGEGPRPPLYLPRDIRGLAEDPYRALAWVVRKEGGYENSDEPFSEFKWANFFRQRKLLVSDGHAEDVFDGAFKRAMQLARSDDAKQLPGYLSKPRGAEPKKLPKTPKFHPRARSSGAFANVPALKS